jgi:hypothetical protein
VNYLGQVEAILAYASHKAHTMNDGTPVAGVSLGH